MFGFSSSDADFDQAVLDALANSYLKWSQRISDPALSCDIYEYAAKDDEHNCVGCSLNEATWNITSYLVASPHLSPNSVLQANIYFNLMNGLWERMRDVFKVVDAPKKMWDDNASKYAAFKDTRGWANFTKHPGFFALGLHHPIFVAEGTTAGSAAAAENKKAKPDQQWVLIDSTFVNEHWKSPGGESAKKAIGDVVTACVLLPDFDALMSRLCDDYEAFVRQIRDNADYIEMLREVSTTKDIPCFWEEEVSLAPVDDSECE